MKKSFFMMLSCAILSACFSISAPVNAADQDTNADLLLRSKRNCNCSILAGLLAGDNGAFGGGGRGPRGPAGPQGPVGPVGPIGPQGIPGVSPFVTDIGETITFTYSITAAVGLGETFTPFVGLPDGTIVLGTPVTVTLLNVAIPLVVVTPAVHGNYHVGVQSSGALVAVTASALVAATPTITGSSTIIGIAVPVIGLLGFDGQTSVNYTYPVPSTVI